MKSIPYLILTLLVVGLAEAQDFNFSAHVKFSSADKEEKKEQEVKTVEVQGALHLIAENETTDVPFTGTVTDKHDNGVVAIKGAYKDGKRDGPWEYYYDNGQLQAKETFKDGQQHGPWEYYYDNGQLDRKILFKNGKQID